jgi:hypothetical protein
MTPIATNQTSPYPSTTFSPTPPNSTNPIAHREYRESSPTVKNWVKSQITNPRQKIKNYFLSFFPFITWIYRYNFTWFWGDLIAGLTVGAVVVPQGMAYAGLANLAPQFGLYSSFVGVMIYWFFATSKVSTNKLIRIESFSKLFVLFLVFFIIYSSHFVSNLS